MRAHVPVEQLILDNEHRRDYSLLGRSFWAVTALDAINGDWYTVLIDLRNSDIINDVDSIEQAERDAQRRNYGKLDPSLFERLQSISPNDKVPVAIWVTNPSQQSLEEMYAALAVKYPWANEAFQRSGKPFDVGDQKLGNTLEAEYAKMVEEETLALIQPLANSLQEQGDTVEILRGMPVITAIMSKAGILRTASRTNVGAIYLIEGRSKPELDTAIPTDRAPTVWKRGFKGNGVNIGILESGKVDFTGLAGHNYLHQGEVRSCSVGEDLHKTMVASVAASYHEIYTGAAPEATVVDACDDGSLIDIVDGLNWATTRADTINMSEHVEENGQMNFIDMAFDYWALVGNDTIVKSAGNNGITVTAPGMAWNILTVGAIDAKGDPDWANDTMWPLSSWKNFTGGDRKKPEVVAPGASIRAIGLDNVVQPPESGTSLAAPQVAGLSALLIDRHSSLSFWPEAVKAIIMASAVHNISGTFALSSYDGAGAIDAALADMIAITGITDFSNTTPCSGPCWWALGINNSNFPVGTYLNRSFTASSGEHIRVAISWWSHVNCPDQSNCSDQLDTNLNLRIQRPNGSVIATSGSLDNNYEIVDFIAPETGQYTIGIYKYSANETSNFVGIAWVKDATYLPDLRNKDGWVSGLYVRNDSPVYRQGGPVPKVKVQYFNSSGTPTVQDECMLWPNQWCWIPTNENNRIPAGSTGSAIVSGGEDVSVVVVNRAQPTAPAGYAYSGQPLLNAPSTTLYLPETLDLGTWLMRMPVFNTGQSATDIATQFFNSDGGTRAIQTNYNVPINGQSSEFPFFDLDPYNSYIGAGRISASQPVAAVAQAYESNNAGRRLGYWATSSATTTVWLPFVMTRLNNGWGATVWVQNTSTDTDSSVSIDFFQEISRTVYRTTGALPLLKNGMTSFNLRTNDYGLGWGWFGSAQVKTNPPVPIAVIVNQLNDGSNLGASYEGIPTSAGSKSVILPCVSRDNASCFYSNFTVRNLGSSDAVIIINYFHSTGAPAATSYDNVVSHRIYNLYTATPSGQNFPAAPFIGSAVINSSQPIAVTTNLVNYCGTDDTSSYIGVHR